ncbi:MAG: Membrane protein insertase YidC, partial [Chlamydiia bacterium]|nr:Membrane protein insertase YidC [Chlamydiia bacterium]
QVKAIQERHKKDPQKAQQEIVALYREYGVNPLSGCLPLLIQMPFLIGMFDLLKSAFELRGASFIPGWINDLSAPDVLFTWSYPLPLFGTEFHLLPFLLGGIMFVQQNMMSSMPTDKAQWTDQQRQQRAMGNMMTLVMAVMFYQFPSGLNIYWISSMALSMVQQWWTNRSMDKKGLTPSVIVEIPKKKTIA